MQKVQPEVSFFFFFFRELSVFASHLRLNEFVFLSLLDNVYTLLRDCVETLSLRCSFFFFVWCHHFCVSGFTLTVKEYPTRRNFVKYFIFTPSHVVTWIFFRQVSRFVFQDSGCELSSVHSISYVRFPSLSPSEYEYVFAHFVACLSLFSSLFEKWADHVLQSHSRRKERGKKKDTTKRMDLQRQAKDKRGACHIVIYLQISS